MRKRIIIIAILALIFIEISSFIAVEFLKNKEKTNYLIEKTNATEIKLRAVRGSYKIMIETLFKQIISKQGVLDLYSKAVDADNTTKTEIRTRLYNLLLPTYNQLKKSNIRQFIFILPNNETFLRFHRPKKYGDDLTDIRYSVKMANKTKQIYTGFEEGRTYNGFRNIFPIFYKNKHIGVIEISFSFAINLLFKQDDDVYDHMMNKDISNLKLNIDERKNYVQSLLSDQYLHEKEFLHYKNDKENVLKQIDKNIKHEIADRLNNNENFTIHHYINKADYLITFVSVKNVQGNPVAYMISYHKDTNIISDLKRQFFIIHIISLFLIFIIILYILLNYLKKLKLKKMDTQYMNIIDANTDVVVVLDKQGIQLYFNKQIEILLGYKRINVIGKSITEFIPESESSKLLDALKEIFIKEEKISFESYVLHNKGHLIPVEIIAQIMIYDEKKVVVCTIRDIRERREAQQKLIDNEIQQRKILETFKEGIYIVSSEYEIIYANSALQKKIGTKAVGEKCYKAVHNLEKKCRWCIFEDLKKKKESIDYEFETDDKKTLISNNILLDNNSKLTVLADITKRKKVEQALKESEDRLSKILLATNDGMWDWNLITNETYYDPRYFQMAGYEIDAFPHNLKEFQKRIHPDDIEYVMNNAQKHIERRSRRFNVEFRFKKKDGNWLWIMGRGVIVEWDKDNNPTRFIGTHTDITDRKKAEQALKESEEKYRGVVENMIDGFYKTDRNGNVILFSPSVTKILGFSEEDIIGKPVDFFYANPEERNLFLKKIKETGRVENHPNQLKRKGKESIFVEVNAQIIYKEGKYDGVEGVFRDVTDRKKAEQALKESEEVLNLMIENSNDGIGIIKDEKFVFVNTTYSKILDYSVKELLQLNLQEILSEESFTSLKKEISHYLETDKDSINLEVVMKKKDKSLIDIEIIIKKIKYKGDTVQLSQIRDITKQKEMIKLLQRGAEQTKGLKEFIPICAGCSQIRDDEKENKPWKKPADYITERLPEIKFSHTMCPDCMKKWYPDYKSKKK